MKLKRVILRGAIQTQGYKLSFLANEADLQYDEKTQCVVINKVTYVPIAHVAEFTIDPFVQELKTNEFKQLKVVKP